VALDDKPLAEWHVGPDWQIAKDDAHCLALGRIVAHLQTVETLIRLALHEDHDLRVGGKPSVGLAAFHLLKKGDCVAIDGNDHFEDYAMLKDLLKRFNGRFPNHALNEDLIVLRDAIAHGRVMPVKYGGEEVLKLLKFEKPVKGSTNVEVAFSALLIPDWFRSREAFVCGEIEKVRAAARNLSQTSSST